MLGTIPVDVKKDQDVIDYSDYNNPQKDRTASKSHCFLGAPGWFPDTAIWVNPQRWWRFWGLLHSHWIGLRDNFNWKFRYLMGKTMVSGEDFPTKSFNQSSDIDDPNRKTSKFLGCQGTMKPLASCNHFLSWAVGKKMNGWESFSWISGKTMENYGKLMNKKAETSK